MEKQQISFIQNLIVSYECALAIGNSLNLSEMLHEFIHTIVHKTNAHRGIIWVRNEENEPQPIASAGIRLKDVLAQKGISPDLSGRNVFHQILGKQKFVIKNRDEKDFLQYCSIITEKEESILIVSINNVAILHLIYASREIVDESLGNMLAGLSRKLSVAIEACMAHENITKEIGIKKETKDKLQKLYTESEQSRKSLQSILEDVVEKEHALQTSEEKYRMLIDNIQDGVFIIQDAKMQFVNEAFAKIVGYTVEEVIGMDFRELVAPEDLEMVADRYRRRQAGEDVPKEYEFRMLHKDKKTRVIVNMNVGLINYQGRVASMGTVKDITERKRAEQVQTTIYKIAESVNTVKKLEELFQSIHNLIGGLMPANNFYIALLDSKTDLIHYPYWVDEYDEMPLPRKPGKGLTEYVIRTGKPLLATPEVFEELVRKGEVESLGAPAVDWLGVPLKTDSRVIGVLVVQSYIEEIRYGENEKNILVFVSEQVAMAIEHKRAEEELAEREKRYRALFDLSPSGIVLEDVEGNIVDVNEAFCKSLGYSREELVGNNVRMVVPPEQIRNIESNIALLRSGKALQHVIEDVRKDGTRCLMELYETLISLPDGREGFLGVAHDITERKRAELLQDAVYRISQAAIKAASLDDLFKSLHEIISTVMPAKNFYISLYDDRKDLISFPYFIDEFDTVFPPMKPGKGLTAYVIRTGKSLLCDEATDKELRRLGEIELIGTLSPIWLGVPLSVENKTIGAMVVQHYTDPNAFGLRELQLLEYVSSQIAKVIERKWAEEEIRQWRDRYERIVALTGEVVYEWDLLQDRTTWGGSLERVLGYSGKSLESEGFQWRSFVHPDDQRRVFTAVNEALQTLTSLTLEYRFRHKDGNYRHVLDQSFIVRDATGKAVRSLGSLTDITERKRAEENLRKEQERHRNVVENIFKFVPEGLLVFTDKLNLLKRNKAFEELVKNYALKLNYTEEELENVILEQIKQIALSGGAADIRIPRKMVEQ
ncbi:MAG: PAS domain S-box protein [Bacteroidetes bacterium]|nr:PAS domain S-box protein [Bacteroidota bacterium]MBU1423411.1 PAS domain S-box protein [Bacteroidota bacterium]